MEVAAVGYMRVLPPGREGIWEGTDDTTSHGQACNAPGLAEHQIDICKDSRSSRNDLLKNNLQSLPVEMQYFVQTNYNH